MLHVFIGEILADMTQVSDVAPGPLVYNKCHRLSLYVSNYKISSFVEFLHTQAIRMQSVNKRMLILRIQWI
jgi:hypothetical protein